MGQELPLYPRAAIALDNGDLMQVTQCTVTQDRTVAVQNTMRQTASGVFIGHEKTELTFKAKCPETGPEREYYKMLRTGKIKTVRVKIPAETFAVVGAVSKRVLTLPEDAPIEYDVDIQGKTVV
jgi:hypothetical protein